MLIKSGFIIYSKFSKENIIPSTFCIHNFLLQKYSKFQMSQEQKLAKKNKIVTEVDDFGRKKFILQEDSESEQPEDEDKVINTGRHASMLIGRDEKIGIEKYIGKLQNNKKDKKSEVFYCQVCKIGFKCDLAYITHVNSTSHNRKLGMNMKVQAASIDDVSQKLASLKGKTGVSKKDAKMEKLLEKERVKNQQEYFEQNEERQRTIKGVKQSKLEAKKQQEKAKIEKEDSEQQEEEQEEEDEMMKIMGFNSFGTKKKKY